MKIVRLISMVIVCSSIIAYSSNLPNNENSCEKSYSLILGILEKGIVHIELHDVPCGIVKSLRDCYAGESVFSLDLDDHAGLYNVMSCDQSTDGTIVIRSQNETMYDYCLNWGPMLGVDICSGDRITYLNVTVEKQEQGCCYLFIEGEFDNKPVSFRMYVDKDVRSACACVISNEIAASIKSNTQCMSLTDACRLGVVATISRHQPLDANCDLISELEFDRIIDSMMHDGTIKIKQDTPWMIHLKSVGSTLLVKYLAIKSYIARTWNRIIGNEPSTVQASFVENL